MPAFINIEKRYTDWRQFQYNNQSFMILGAKEMLMDFITYKEKPIEWDLKTAMFIGSQGSGKTVLIRYLTLLINSYFGEYVSVVRTNDTRVLEDKECRNLFFGKKVIILIIDDAIRSGFDSRRSMSGANVEISQQFLITRHILETYYGKNGIIFLIFAFQEYSRLDKTIRNNAILKIFTSYYDNDWFQKLFTPDQSELLRIATYEGMFKSNFSFRRFALAKANTGEIATLEVPFISKEKVDIPYITRTIDLEEIKEKLVDCLLTIENFSDFTKGELMGKIEICGDEIKKEYHINIPKSIYVSAVNKAMYIRKDERLNEEKNKEKISSEFMKKFTVFDKTPKKYTIEEKALFYLYFKGASHYKDMAKWYGIKPESMRIILHSSQYFNSLGRGIFELKKSNNLSNLESSNKNKINK